MAKKVLFMLLIIGLMAVWAVVSMATPDGMTNFNGAFTDATLTGATIPCINIEEEQQIKQALQDEAYTYEKIIEEYDSLFFDKDIKTKEVYVKDIVIKQQDARNASSQDYELLVTLADNINLEHGDSITIMAFVEKNGKYELLGSPNKVVTKYPKPYRFGLPTVSEKQPNRIRIIVFLKNNYVNVISEDNLQIEDRDVIIPGSRQNFSIRGSLINYKECFDILKKLVIK